MKTQEQIVIYTYELESSGPLVENYKLLESFAKEKGFKLSFRKELTTVEEYERKNI